MREISLAALSLIADPPRDAIRAAAAAGFDSVGLRLAAIPGSGVDNQLLGSAGARERRALRGLLDDLGLAVLDAEVFRLTPADGYLTPQEPLLAAARELGARYVGVVSYEPDRARAADLLAQLAAAAAEYELGCQLEFMGFSQAHTLAEAAEIVAASGAPNAHVLVDPLHVARTALPVNELAAAPRHLFTMAQICDAATDTPQPDQAAARAEAISARLAPGEGVLPLAEVIAALPPQVPLSVEVPRGADAAPADHARVLSAAIRRVLGD